MMPAGLGHTQTTRAGTGDVQHADPGTVPGQEPTRRARPADARQGQ